MNKIKFEYCEYDGLDISDEYFNLIKPKSLKKFLPTWYLKTLKHETYKKITGFTIKKCVPVFDYMTSGYVIPSDIDLLIKKDAKGYINIERVGFKDRLKEEIVSNKHSVLQFKEFVSTEVFKDYYGEKNLLEIENFNTFKFMNPWKIVTPKGYSCLFYRPFFHDTKINIFPGIVDTDVYKIPISLPYLINLKKNESYKVSVGDPIAVVFPFKRDEWVAECYRTKQSLHENNFFFENYYRKLFHKKKSYD